MGFQNGDAAGYGVTNGNSVHICETKDARNYSTNMHDLAAYMGSAAIAERNLAKFEGREVRNEDVRWTNQHAIREIERLTGNHPRVAVVESGRRVLLLEYGDTYKVTFVAYAMDGGAY